MSTESAPAMFRLYQHRPDGIVYAVIASRTVGGDLYLDGESLCGKRVSNVGPSSWIPLTDRDAARGRWVTAPAAAELASLAAARAA